MDIYSDAIFSLTSSGQDETDQGAFNNPESMGVLAPLQSLMPSVCISGSIDQGVTSQNIEIKRDPQFSCLCVLERSSRILLISSGLDGFQSGFPETKSLKGNSSQVLCKISCIFC